LAGRPRESRRDDAVSAAVETKHDFLLAGAMWLARFLVQISDAALFAYLYYYFRSIDPSRDAAWIARLFGLVVGLSVPVALLVGRWSDRRARPMIPLVATAATAGLALSAMAASRVSFEATAAYVVFGASSTIFLSLHSAQTFRVLRRSARRGRDLGLFNLTNTVPSLIMPWLTIAIVPEFGFSRLFALLGGLAFVAAFILLGVTKRLRKA
jgi:MFS family permease